MSGHDPSLSTNGSKRMRSRRACVPCSTRKRKCDGTLPCNACTGYGYECRYRQDSNRKRPRPCPSTTHGQNNRLDTPGVAGQPPMRTIPTDTEEQVTESDSGLLAVSSSRYLGRHSAEAFPRFLGLQFQAQVLPRLQPFAWNLEVREMAPCRAKGAICSLITVEATRKQLRSFFLSDFPACGFLDLGILTERCEKHWVGHDQGLPFEALIGGMIGLASVLDNAINIRQEADIIQHAANILNDPVVLSEPSAEVLAAIVLRCLYLRATATPHVTWLLSCSAMHMAEALGLHKDYDTNAGKHRNMTNPWDDDAISCMFWIICAGNRILSHELGRSPVVLHGVTRKFPFSPLDTSGAATLCRLSCLLPTKEATEVSDDDDQECFKQSLDAIAKTARDHAFLRLIAADVCFCLYRQIHVSNHRITKEECQQVVLVGRAAVEAVNQLLHKGRPWWNMLGTLFQFCCVLISMDSLDSLADLQYAVKTINLVQDRYPGEKVGKALSTLRALIKASKQRKQTQIAYLSAVEEPEEPCINMQNDVSFSPTDLTFSEIPLDIASWGTEDLDWMSLEAPLSL